MTKMQRRSEEPREAEQERVAATNYLEKEMSASCFLYLKEGKCCRIGHKKCF